MSEQNTHPHADADYGPYGDDGPEEASTENVCAFLATLLCPAGEPHVGPDAIAGSDHGHTVCYMVGLAIRRLRGSASGSGGEARDE